jgi:hypothetical protein
LSLRGTFWKSESGGGAAVLPEPDKATAVPEAGKAAAGRRIAAAVMVASTVFALMPLSFGLLGGIREDKYRECNPSYAD